MVQEDIDGRILRCSEVSVHRVLIRWDESVSLRRVMYVRNCVMSVQDGEEESKVLRKTVFSRSKRFKSYTKTQE